MRRGENKFELWTYAQFKKIIFLKKLSNNIRKIDRT